MSEAGVGIRSGEVFLRSGVVGGAERWLDDISGREGEGFHLHEGIGEGIQGLVVQCGDVES